ncbi:hypothetical protein FNU79_15055 [Deinococcus detaillensis]|uniref:Uncharacterized protein n=1 Tax=Deinococcus detaillensis TaxID=2592048 RepID=A0A553UMJ2_9DEIO|nr:hypothetical protein [Deinococcus detaillensis]TSA81446.1 hypothetical protein FNU79_15055 [Deinococcus detaillensis]
MSLRLSLSDAKIVRVALAAVQVKLQQIAAATFSDKPAVALGRAAVAVCSDWLNAEEVMDDGEVSDLMLPNTQSADPELIKIISAADAA